MNNAFTNSGTFQLAGTSAVTIGGDFANSGSLLADISGFGDGGASLTIGGTLNNTNTVQIGPNNGTLTAATTLTLGGLSNPSGAGFSVIGSSSHPATLAFSSGGSGFTSNGGSFLLSNTTPLTLNNAFTNSGTFQLAGTSAVTIGGDFANSGSLLADISGFGDGGASLTIGGTLNNTNTVQIGPNNGTLTAATTLTLGGLSNPSGAGFSVIGSSSHPATLAFSSGGSGFTSNGGSFLLSNTTPLTLNNAFTNSGTFQLAGTSAVTIGGDFANSGSLLADISGFGDGGASLTIGGTLNNTNTVQIGPNNGTLTAATTLTLGGLSNPSGAGFSVIGSSSHPATLAFSSGGSGFTSNGGSFLLSNTTPLTLNNAFTNSGTFQLPAAAAVTIGGDFANSGSLLADISGFGDGGGSLTVGGTLNNTNTVQVGPQRRAERSDHLTVGGLSKPRARAFRFRLGQPSGGIAFTAATTV